MRARCQATRGWTATIPGLLLSLALFPATAFAEAVDLRYEVLDLKYSAEDIGGAVLDFKVQETDLEVRFQISGDVLFDFDRFDLRPKAESILGELAARINKRFPSEKVRVEGHTDTKGVDNYNFKLSQQRADSVKRWLASKGGIAATRIQTKGFGETRPVAPNAKPDGSDDPEGRQKNRRVEIIVEKK